MPSVPEQHTEEGDEMIPESILRDIDQLLQTTNLAERDHLAKSIRRSIEALPRFSEDAEAQYLWGFIAFIDPSRKNNLHLREACRESLQRSLAIDPGHGRAWLYLGHLLLEEDCFIEASAAFAQAECFLEKVSMYFKIKATEMLAVSAIASGGIMKSLCELERYAAIVECAEAEDIWPAELCEALKAAPKCDDDAIEERLAALARRIDVAGRLGSWVQDAIKS
jgi:tetratricopeptide (TPR) repeat protein